MPRTKRLSCVNCGQFYEAVPPASNFTNPDLKPCEFPDYDIIQTAECEQCDYQFKIYWHNPELERKHLLELKELFYLRNRYSLLKLGTINAYVKIQRHIENSIDEHAKLTEAGHPEIFPPNYPTVEQLKDRIAWLEEFSVMKLKDLKLSDKQMQRIRRDNGRRITQFGREYSAFVKRKELDKKREKENHELLSSSK